MAIMATYKDNAADVWSGNLRQHDDSGQGRARVISSQGIQNYDDTVFYTCICMRDNRDNRDTSLLFFLDTVGVQRFANSSI